MNELQTREVFAERMAPVRRFDAALYFATGAEIFGEETEPVLYRLRLDSKATAVRWEPLAFFHARIIARETRGTGQANVNPKGSLARSMTKPRAGQGTGQGRHEVIAVIAGRNRNGAPFLFRCPLAWLTSGKGSDAKRFMKAFYSTPGTVPSYVRSGKLAATLRAIVALSEEGEPMPHTADELTVMND
jgi:hypothetical protein